MKWPWSVKTLDERSCEEVGTMLWIKGDNPPATPRLNRRNLLNFLYSQTRPPTRASPRNAARGTLRQPAKKIFSSRLNPSKLNSTQ